MANYNPKSLKAEEFINDGEILDTLAYAEANKNNMELINEILEKARPKISGNGATCAGLTHREASVLLACEDKKVIERIYQIAEEIKIRLGAAVERETVDFMTVSGRDLVRGLPVNVALSTDDIRDVLMESSRFFTVPSTCTPSYRRRTPPKQRSSTVFCSFTVLPVMVSSFSVSFLHCSAFKETAVTACTGRMPLSSL